MRLFLALLLLSPPALAAPTGAKLFADLCALCHGADAAGGNSPDIRGVILSDVTQATNGIEDMPEFNLTPAELSALAEYLSALAPEEAARRRAAQARTAPKTP